MLISNRLRSIIISVALLFVLWVWFWEPFKVTDPDDPRFDRHSFRFSDYSGVQQFSVFAKILKEGMPRSEVEQILVQSGNAHAFQITSNMIRYDWMYPWWQWRLLVPRGDQGSWAIVLYDQQSKLKALTIRGVDVINAIDIDKEFNTRRTQGLGK